MCQVCYGQVNGSVSQWVSESVSERCMSHQSDRIYYKQPIKFLVFVAVSQGLGTTKFTNLIGWNGYWPQSRFSLDQHLDRLCFEVKKLQTKMHNHWLFSSNNIYFCKWQKADEKTKVKRTSKIRKKNEIWLVAVRKQNVSCNWNKPVT